MLASTTLILLWLLAAVRHPTVTVSSLRNGTLINRQSRDGRSDSVSPYYYVTDAAIDRLRSAEKLQNVHQSPDWTTFSTYRILAASRDEGLVVSWPLIPSVCSLSNRKLDSHGKRAFSSLHHASASFIRSDRCRRMVTDRKYKSLVRCTDWILAGGLSTPNLRQNADSQRQDVVDINRNELKTHSYRNGEFNAKLSEL